MEQKRSLAGSLLLAMPGMPDQRFDHAVIALCLHDAQGALGIGLGELVKGVTLHNLLDDLDIPHGQAPDCPVHVGGPIEPQRGFVLHSPDWEGDGTLKVSDQWSLTGSLAILHAIAQGTGPRYFTVALGYAGWSEGQLEREMKRHGWHVVAGRADIVFHTSVEARWMQCWRKGGVNPSHLAGQTGHA